MSEYLRQFFFTRPGNLNDRRAKPYGMMPVEAADRQDPPEMFALMERIHHRLDIIEQKIDRLLMPVDVIRQCVSYPLTHL